MHRFALPALTGEPTPPADPAQAEAIRRWTIETLRLPDEAVVRVFEASCLDPGCPIVETAIAVFADARTRTWRFARPRVAVTKAMVVFALQSKPEGE